MADDGGRHVRRQGRRERRRWRRSSRSPTTRTPRACSTRSPGSATARPAWRSSRATVPNPLNLPKGCLFKRRCPYAMPICDTPPPLQKISEGHLSRCWLTPEGKPPEVGAAAPPEVAEKAAAAAVGGGMSTFGDVAGPDARGPAARGRDARASSGSEPHERPDRAGRGARPGRERRQALRDPRRAARHPPDRCGPGRRRRLVLGPARRDPRPRRRVRLRQDDPRQGHAPPHPAHLREGVRQRPDDLRPPDRASARPARSPSCSATRRWSRSGATCRSCSRTRTPA